VRLARDYMPPPILVTENGMANADVVAPDGSIADTPRVAYLQAHLDAVAKAIALGVDVRGYFYWSLLDNFEWDSGYAKRFGLLRVDYETQARTPKASAHWYRDFIAHHKSER
jgi:beta-glucosidase